MNKQNKQLVVPYQPKESTDGAWIRQPLALLRRDGGLSKPAALVLAVIIDRATDYDPPRPVQAAVHDFAWSTGYSERAVRDALADLVRRGLISVRRTGRGSVYELTGAVELLPPKKRTQQQQQQQRQQQRQRKKPAETWIDPGYGELVNRFHSAPEVCDKPATEGDPDYEL